MEEESVWLTQLQMAELIQTTKQNISLHINKIFKEGELNPLSVVKDCLTTAADGKNYRTKYFNLDVIISVGYRVKSLRGTQFRQWANRILKQYLVKVKCQSTSSTSGMNKHVETLHQTWLSLQLNPVFFKKRPQKMTDDR